jgi:crotonobetainyl-CoA:carnitine CoA-transferase CaiB-like acyl-CoA transferase
VHSTAPALGEHTDDILGALGVSAQQVAEMRGTGAI